MSYQETTHVSWFTRLKQSIGGIVIGLILVVAMVAGLFWNEGRAVTTARSLAEGAGIVVSVPADRVDPGNESRLVHVTGTVETTHGLSDPEFGISATGVRLVRVAEMFQWRETSKSETQTKLGGGQETVTTYSYSTGWERQAIDSAQFRQPQGRDNPPMLVGGQTFQIPDANLGAYDLDERVLGAIGGARALPVTADQIDTIQQAVGAGVRAHVADGRIFLGSTPQQPQVGDYRIGFELVPLGPISVIARQAGSRFEPYQTQAGNQLLMVDSGTVSAELMFDQAMTSNTVMTWIIRIVGLVLLGIGFSLILRPLAVVGDVIPFVGSIVRMGTGAVSFVLAALVGSVTIAIAWFFYRPVLALVIIAIGVATAFAITWLGRKKRAGGPGDTAPPPEQPAAA